MYFADLRKPILRTFITFDLAMSIEVAEHIEPEYADIFVHNLCILAPRLLLTIASPGQVGHGHHNLQSKQYWETKFAIHEYIRNAEIENQLLDLFESHCRKQVMRAFIHNLIYFEKG
jgi:hypothetical protein